MSTDADRARAIARTGLAYHRVFGTPDGKAVLADLVKCFGLEMPAYIPDSSGVYNDTLGKLRDGQRSVYLHILAKLSVKPEADGNVKPKKKVKSNEL